MFDIGFSEMLVIGVVALVVIGPERMPGVARTAGALFGRAQRYVTDLKADIQNEVDLQEFKSIKSTFQDAASSIEHSAGEAEEELNAAAKAFNESIAAQSRGQVHAAIDAANARLNAAPVAAPAASPES